jgi:hypothetical protein
MSRPDGNMRPLDTVTTGGMPPPEAPEETKGGEREPSQSAVLPHLKGLAKIIVQLNRAVSIQVRWDDVGAIQRW